MVSPDSETIDRIIKRDEYAAAGIPRYWVVGNDKANAVQLLALTDGSYRVERDVSSLTWLLNEPVPPLA